MQVRSFCLLTFALPLLAALALPRAVHAVLPRNSSRRRLQRWEPKLLSGEVRAGTKRLPNR